MPEIQYKNVGSEVRIMDDKEGIVDALVSTTNLVDHGKDNILPGAYTKTLRERTPKVCWAHAWEHPIGKCLDAKELLPGHTMLSGRHKNLNAGALWTRSQLNLKVQAGRDALEWLKFWTEENPVNPQMKTTAEWSIGYDCSGTTGDGEQKSYRDTKSGIRYIKALDLFEFSPVAHGMAPLTETLAIKDLPRPYRVIVQAAKAMQDGVLSPLAELSLDELAGAIDLKDYSTKKGPKQHDPEGSGNDVHAVQANEARIHSEPEPDNHLPGTASAGGDGSTKPEEDSYDDGDNQKPGKPNGHQWDKDDDATSGGGKEESDTDDGNASEKVGRHTVRQWVNLIGGKDWAEWNAEHDSGEDEPEEETKPTGAAPKPSSGAPKPSSGAPKPSSGAGGKPDAVADTAPEKPSGGEGGKPQDEGGEGEAGKLAEGIQHVVETVRDAYHEGREQGDRWAEQWSASSESNQKRFGTLKFGSHEATKAAAPPPPTGAISAQEHLDEIDTEHQEHTDEQQGHINPVEKAFAAWKLKSASQTDDDADDADHPPKVGNTDDTDGYVESDSGFRGDATSRVDAPQDAALDTSLSKRGISDEDGRTDRSAMKQVRFQSKRDFDANVGGGVDRDKLPASDFVYPDKRSFPIVTAKDVQDAVDSWGQHVAANPGASFEDFKKRLTAIAKRKGLPLPEKWKNEKAMASESVSSKAWVNLEGSYEDTIADLGEAVDRMVDSVFPDMDVCAYVEGTFPGKAIIGVVHNGDPGDCQVEYWSLPYSINNDDVVTLSAPSAVDVQGVAIDRMDNAKSFNFLSPSVIAAKGLQRKNATRLWRRYSLLSSLYGIDPEEGHPGLTRDLLRLAPEGLSNIPGASDADFRTGQMDLSQPGGADPNIPDNTPMRGQTSNDGYDSGNLEAPPLPAWYQGVWYVDNAGNLSAAPVSMDAALSGSGMKPADIDSSLWRSNGLSTDMGNMTSPALTGVLGTTLDAGSLSLAGRKPGEQKNETRIQRHRRLLDLFNARVPNADEPLSDSTDTDLKGIITTVSEAFTEVKEGRILSAANAGKLSDAHEAMGHIIAAHAKLAEAHSAMGDLLRQAGVEPSVFEPVNDTPGKDEEGVSIEPVDAPNDTKALLDGDLIAEWRALQTEAV